VHTFSPIRDTIHSDHLGGVLRLWNTVEPKTK